MIPKKSSLNYVRYSLILWDFDGTLADTLPSLLKIYNQLALHHGFKPIDDPASLRDKPMAEIIKSLGISRRKVPRLIRMCVSGQPEMMKEIALFPGVIDALQSCKSSGLQMGIVSTNSEKNIRACLAANGAGSFFDFIAGYSRLFGKQRALRRVLRRNPVDPKHVLYVGDEVRDVLAAHRVGVDVAAVTWGMNSATVLSQYSPTHLIRSPEQLESVLNCQ